MRRTFWLSLVAASVLTIGCEDKPTVAADAGTEDAGARPALGGKLGQAVKAVESGSPAASGAADGPPPKGIFAPGTVPISDKVPPKVELFSEGSDPKIALHAADIDAEQKVPLLVVLVQGRQMMIPPTQLDLVVSRKGDKAEGAPGAAATASPSAAPSAPPADGARFVARIADAKLLETEGMPKELGELSKMLKGNAIEFSLTKGGPVDFSRVVSTKDKKDSKEAEAAKDAANLPLRIIEEALNGLYVPAPDKPVGEGAYWMVSDRHPSLGVDVVRYRVFRINKIEGDQASISIEIRQYAASDAFDLPLGSQAMGMKITQYGVAGKGVADVAPKSIFPVAAGFGLRTEVLLGSSAAQGGKQATLQLEITAQLGKDPPKGAMEQAPPNAPH